MQEKNPSSAAKVNKFKELARSVIAHHFGSKPRRIEHRSAGLSNLVFSVSHKEGDFVVRISPDAGSLNVFIKEQWAESAARKAGVPTAEILEVGSSVIPFPYMIVRKVEGTNGLHHEKRRDIVSQMGSHAALINSVKTRGFGSTFDWSNNRLSRNETWKEYLENEYDFTNRIETLEKHKLIDKQRAKELNKIMRAACSLRPKSVLTHSDIRLKNVMADESGKVTAIIDWDNSISSIGAEWEFSIALHDLGIDEKQLFLEGYGIKPKKFHDATPLIKAFNMLNYTQEAERLAAEKNRKGLDMLRLRFSGSFDLYSL
jgi:aminoglycoside phosphotransferase (APT) family kinase protein